jgi:hypothetical protein
MTIPQYGQPYPPNPPKPKRRRRWPWITGAVVLAIFVLAGILGNTQQPTSTPASDTISSTSSAPTPARVTTTVPAAVAPVTTTTVRVTRAAVIAPRHTTVHHVAPKPKPVPKPKPKPTTRSTPAPPAPGRYHAGEFCKTLGATAISSNGKAITCIQEGNHKRWHND